MKLIPYVLVDDLPFVATRAQVLLRHGAPQKMQRNGVGLDELDYGDWVARFQDSGRLEEVTRRAPVLQVGEVRIAFAALADWVRRHDADVFERGGFVVSPRYGITFIPEEPDWVTALAAHSIPVWRSMGQAP